MNDTLHHCSFIGDKQAAKLNKGVTAFEQTTSGKAGTKRRREARGDPESIDGYLGPWASYEDEVKVSKPTEASLLHPRLSLHLRERVMAHLYAVHASIEDTIGTQLAVLYTVEPLYSGHHWDPAGCPV